jgi:lipoprotein-anchoring transpeptidase ErfK/SrfK
MKKYKIQFCILFALNFSCNANISNNYKGENPSESEAQKYASSDSSIAFAKDSNSTNAENCKQLACAIWAKVNLTEQILYLYENGILLDTFKVSTGDKRHKTPIMDRRFGGRMYKKYTSKKFPGGDYMGLGNMPYVVFIKGGYAIHGTTPGNFNMLGRVASHGCIRLHPDNAKIFFELIQEVGAANTWITVTY